jgi:hypothetical protein
MSYKYLTKISTYPTLYFTYHNPSLTKTLPFENIPRHLGIRLETPTKLQMDNPVK